MSLRELAEADLARIQEDASGGFGWSITVTDPAGNTADLTGFSNDISQMIDPETGTYVSGRAASVSIRIQHLADKGLGIPRNISDAGSRPWTVTFQDLAGQSYSFKVSQAMPDRGIGNVACMLEAFE